MRYSVCVIDDKIPASGLSEIRDSDLLNGSNLQLLQQKEELWTDAIVKNLVKTLLDEKNTDGISPKWDVYGFTNPAFYVNTLNDGLFRSDIIIFDWEYPGTGAGAGTDSESILKEILAKSFCLVFVFSGADKKTEIETILAKPEFQEYKERLFYLDKTASGADQTRTLLDKAQEMYEHNFSFRFAGDLRKKTLQCIDSILSDVGKASLNDIRNHVVVGDGGKRDFIDFLAERFRAAVAGQDVYDLLESSSSTPVPVPADNKIAEKIWSYRLYFPQKTGDDLLRRGDIIKKDGNIYLVISADCDLTRFWHKNLGIVNTISLHELNVSNDELKAFLTPCIKRNELPSELGHLLASLGKSSEGPFVLPFVPVNNNPKHFIAIPKDIISHKICLSAELMSLSEKQRKDIPMKYSYWPGTERICTISEPFLTPVTQHVLKVLGGQGVPDYPESMQKILKKILEDFVAVSPTAGAAVQDRASAAANPPPIQ